MSLHLIEEKCILPPHPLNCAPVLIKWPHLLRRDVAVDMGILLFLIGAIMEIVLALWAIRNARTDRNWRRNRLIVRAVEFATILITFLLPIGQKWRLMPALLLSLLLLVIAVVVCLVHRKTASRKKKTAHVIVGCILNIALFFVILIPAFVFSGYKGLGVTGSYDVAQADVILVDESRVDPFESDGSKREVPVHFYYPDHAKGESFPLIVFSHGAFGYYESNFSTYEELASNGYVIAALDHPHHAFFTHDTEGKLVLVDQNFLNTAIAVSNEAEYEEDKLHAIENEWMQVRVPDLDFVITAIKEAKDAGALSPVWVLSGTSPATIAEIMNVTNVGKIGVMGHSMGGATSVQIGRERDDIDAVIDIDGTMLGEYIRGEDGTYTVSTLPYSLPILEFVNWATYNELADISAKGIMYPNEVLMANADEGFRVTVRDTEHMDFTDLPILSPFLGKMLGSGSRDTKETMTIVNGLILDFYNCYLKGQGSFHPQEIY